MKEIKAGAGGDMSRLLQSKVRMEPWLGVDVWSEKESSGCRPIRNAKESQI